MKNQKLKKQLIAELYQLDPSLKTREKEIIAIIDSFLATKPQVQLNKEFQSELHSVILAKLKETHRRKLSIGEIWKLMPLSRKLAFSGVLMLIVTAVSTLGFLKSETESRQGEIATEPQAVEQFVHKDTEAFGKLSALPSSQSNAELATKASLSAEQAVGAGGMPVAEMGFFPGRAADFPAQYIFEYIGKKLNLAQEKRTVYRRIKKIDTASFQRLLPLNPAVIDLKSFENTTLQSFSFAEDKPFGLSINVNAGEGTISLYRNWEKWQTKPQCERRVGCTPAEPLKPEDVPQDQELLAIATQFIQKHRLDMSNFEKSTVIRHWEDQIRPPGAPAYIPDDISVLYPLKVQNTPVFNGSGEKAGLRMQINLREKRVSGVHQLTSQRYETSDYLAETDFEKMVELAKEKSSYWPTPRPLATREIPEAEQEADSTKEILAPDKFGINQADSSEKLTTLLLDTPSLALVQHWHYFDNQNQELFIPALVFPVQNAAEHQFQPKNIVIPLIKGLQNKVRY